MTSRWKPMNPPTIDEGFLGWRKETGKRAKAAGRCPTVEAFGWDLTMPKTDTAKEPKSE